ncbi:hypothetical protein [Desulforapulum autotrophicum]|uniref:hypothetical protein n=1 Tax=Desulforapulum autotrophicum TaxID=2296 RepID=UPI001E5FA76A|nr:hypothetical protein [Desulforapulum autotrophicum]
MRNLSRRVRLALLTLLRDRDRDKNLLLGIRTCFLLKKVLNIPKVKKYTPPLIQGTTCCACIRGCQLKSRQKSRSKKQAGNSFRFLKKFQNRANFEYRSP